MSRSYFDDFLVISLFQKNVIIENFKHDKCTDTDDLIVVECTVELKEEDNGIQKRSKSVKKGTKSRKKEKLSDDDDANVEEMEIETFDYDNDDYENVPTFGINSDQEAGQYADDAEDDEIGDAGDFNNINDLKAPRKKRRREQLYDDKNLK